MRLFDVLFDNMSLMSVVEASVTALHAQLLIATAEGDEELIEQTLNALESVAWRQVAGANLPLDFFSGLFACFDLSNEHIQSATATVLGRVFDTLPLEAILEQFQVQPLPPPPLARASLLSP